MPAKRVPVSQETGLGSVSLSTGLSSRPRRRSRGFFRRWKAGRSSSKNHTDVVERRNVSPPAPCNIYIGENFSVRLNQTFKFSNIIQDCLSSGVIHNDFEAFRNIGNMALSVSAQKIRDVPNAGGDSVVSEVLSYEVLQKCFRAKLLKTEMEVTYFPEGGSITDYTCEMFSTHVGVSVTRAMKYKGNYELEDATRLLTKKLKGILQSSQNTMENWSKQILHIWAFNNDVANVLTQAVDTIDRDIISNTVVIITTARNASDIFTNSKHRQRGCS